MRLTLRFVREFLVFEVGVMVSAYRYLRLSMLIVLFGATFAAWADDDNAEVVDITVQVIDTESTPISAAKVRASSYEFAHDAETDANGEVRFAIPKSRLSGLSLLVDDEAADRLGYWRANWQNPPTGDTPLLVTAKTSKKLPVHVTDAAGEPAADTKVGAFLQNSSITSVRTNDRGEAVLRLPADQPIRTLFASRKGQGFDFRVVSTPRDEAHRADWMNDHPVRLQLPESRTIELQLMDDNEPIVDTKVSLWLLHKPGEPDSFNLSVMGVRDVEFEAVTDSQGVARFEGVPNWDVHPLTFWPGNKAYASDRIEFDSEEHPGGRMVVQLDRLVAISGRVVMPDGSPAEGAEITVDGAGYKTDSFRGTTSTGADGTFEIHTNPNELYMVVAAKDDWVSAVTDGIVTRKKQPIRDVELKLRPATRIHGVVTVGPEKKPVSKQWMSLTQHGRALNDLKDVELPNPKNKSNWIQPNIYRNTRTDENGKYEFFVGPGSFRVSGPSQVKGKEFEITSDAQDRSLELDFAAPRPAEGPIEVEVVTGEPPRPVPNAVVDGKYRAWANRDLRLRTDKSGKATAVRERHRAVLMVQSDDEKLAGVVEIDEDQTSVTIAIGPRASASGIAIDEPTGDPLRNTKLTWGRRVHKGDDDAPWETAWGGSVVTDSEGAFEVDGLVPGQVYYLNKPNERGSTTLTKIEPENSEPIQLGELKVSPPYKPPTFEERIQQALSSDLDPLARFERALDKAKKLRQHVLLIFVDREDALTRGWFKLRFEDRPIRNALHNYQVLHMDVKDEVQPLLDHIGLKLEVTSRPQWLIVSVDGEELLHRQQVPRKDSDDTEDTIDRAAVTELLTRHAPEPLDARELLKEAFAEAKRSDRRVFVQETATWCGPCHLLARFLEEHRERWETDCVWIRMDQRWHGASEVMDSIKEGYRGGIPWYAILSANGEMLANSEGEDGNIGFPGEPAGIDHFISMLETTKQRMQEADIEAIRAALEDR